MSDHATKVFVYGTLKHGLSNHGVLRRLGAKFLGEAIVAQPCKMVIPPLDYGGSGAPVLTLASELAGALSTLVVGELYDVPDEAMQVLDKFEHKYVRSCIDVTIAGETARANTYVQPPSAQLEAMTPCNDFTSNHDFAYRQRRTASCSSPAL
jgi:gamma-glutamylcyclotransferase (GGCT)/AIG2-like uncharacterized protein YtfP